MGEKYRYNKEEVLKDIGEIKTDLVKLEKIIQISEIYTD